MDSIESYLTFLQHVRNSIVSMLALINSNPPLDNVKEDRKMFITRLRESLMWLDQEVASLNNLAMDSIIDMYPELGQKDDTGV